MSELGNRACLRLVVRAVSEKQKGAEQSSEAAPASELKKTLQAPTIFHLLTSSGNG